MAEYNGTIELISGITPKNNGNFALVNAKDVAFYETDTTGETKEIRLDKKIQQVGISQEDREQLVLEAENSVFTDERYTNLSKSVEQNSSAIFGAETGLQSRVQELESQIEEGDNQELKIQFEPKESTLYLYAGDELIKPNPDDDSVISNIISSTTVSGGGSGASLNYKLTLKILDNSSSLTFLHTDTPKIKYIANFIDTTAEEGENNLVAQNLNFKLTVTLPSGAKNTYTFTGMSNTELEYDLTQILSTTTGLIIGDHNVTLTVSYTQEVGDEAVPVTIQSTKKWLIKVTQMYLESSFDDSSIKTGNVPLTVTVYGDLNKTIHYDLNGQKDWMIIENASLSNYDYSITIPKQSHGNYPLEVYLTADVNGTLIRSESLFYDIMFIEEGNDTPVIRAVPSSVKGQQYSNLPIYYSVYSPSNLISVVQLAVDGEVVSTRDTVDRSEQRWDYKSLTEGIKTLTITSGQTTRTLTIEIEKIPYVIESVTAGLELDFLPQGRTNQDEDYNVFHNNVFDIDGNEVPLTWTLSDNFDWVNGGWKVDEKGDSYFCVKAGTSVDINYLLFNDKNTLVGENKTKGNGKEFKIIFKTTNVAKADTTWLSCIAAPDIGDPLGLQMDAHTGYIRTSSGSSYLSVPYSEEDKIEFDINIVPITYGTDGTIDLTQKDIPMIMTYEDGTPVRPLVLDNDQITFKQENPVPISIGSPYCDVHIYRMKAYSTFLSEKNILKNFIADATNAEDMIDRHKRNLIYDSKTGDLTPESYAAACPDTKVIKISAPRFTNDKKDKVLETEIEMIHKNGDPILDNWKAINAIHNGQGTSSNAYGYAARNLELNLKAKDTPRYKIIKAEGVYDKDGKHIAYGSILEGEQDFYDAEGVKYEDPSTIATVTIIPGTTITLGDGVTTVKKVSLTRDSVPTNYFNVKVNVASSEHANNALLQKRYDRYLPYTPYAKSRDENIKNNMNFYNCVIFVQERNEDLTTHQEFNDNEWHFYSIGNIGDSKKTDDTRTSDPEDANEFCVEIMDWNRELSAFPKDTKVAAMAEKYVKKDNDGNITKYIFATQENLEAGVLFERVGGRYVEFPKNGLFNNFEYYFELVDGNYVITQDTKNNSEKTYYEYVDWTYEVSTDTTIDHTKPYYIDILEQDDFSEDYTYGWRYALDDEDSEILASCKAKWIEFYRFVTKDLSYDDKRTDENGNVLEDPVKINAWKEELKDWFVIDAAFYYYLFTLRYTMVDNRAKNSFWHYGKQGSGYKFDFWDYDNDTALGIDNTGKFTMDYGVEDHDTNEGGAAHFRAHNSTFFVRIADYFADELITYYKDTLENKNATVFNSTSLINEFDTWQSEFPEEIWRKQYERVYKRTYVGGYGKEWDNAVNPAQIKKAADPQFLTEMMNGKKKYQRRQFERNQDVYMSSKFFGNTVFQDVLTLRGGGDMDPSQFVIKPNGDITITPYLNMYVNTGVENNKFNHHVKVKAGESVTLKYPTSALEFNYIWGASYLQSLGDLSAMYLRVAKLGQGQRMKQLILGNSTEGYNNPNLDKVEITSNNKLLEELDVRNMSNLGGNIPITNIPSLRKLYAQGTKYQTIQFANNGLIEEAYLPASINKIIANNLYYLHTLELVGYTNLQSLVIDNCPGIDALDIVNAAVNLKTVRLTNINWQLEKTDVLNRLAKCKGIGADGLTEVDNSVLTGKIFIKGSIRQSEIDTYTTKWPDLELIYNEEQIVPQSIVRFEVYDQRDGVTLLDSFEELVDNTVNLNDRTMYIDPIERGLIATPVHPFTEGDQYKYIYKYWQTTNNKVLDGNEYNTIYVNLGVTFKAYFDKEIAYYTVEWKADDTEDAMTVAKMQTKVGEEMIDGVPWGTSVSINDATILGSLPTVKAPDNINYYVFKNWSIPVATVQKNMIIYPQWVSSKGLIDDSVETETLKPEDIYALKTKGTIQTIFKSDDFGRGDGKQIQVQLGYMPDFTDITSEVLAENYDFATSGPLSTGILPFANNESFTLVVDYENAATATAGALAPELVSCYNASTEQGFTVKVSPGKAPSLQYMNGTSYSVGYSNRDIFVIRKNKDDAGLYVYRNNRYSTTPVEEIYIAHSTPFTHELELTFGGRKMSDGKFNSDTFCKFGILKYAKIWFDDLGEDECKNICSWIYDTLNFENVGKSRYTLGEGSTQATFVATELLEQTVNFGATSAITGFSTSSIRTWLQNKVFKGFNLTWQNIINPVQVKTLEGKGGEIGKTITTTDYIYPPAYADVFAVSENDNFANELNLSTLLPFSTLDTSEERKKKLYNTEEQSAYWLRTPRTNTASITYYQYGITMDGTLGTEYKNGAGSGSQDKLGVLICFSI